jgi:hypothetical protein
MKSLFVAIGALVLGLGGFFGLKHEAAAPVVTEVPMAVRATATSTDAVAIAPSPAKAAEKGSHSYTRAELLAMADDAYADGNVPLGDYKYVTDGPKKGYVYLCNVHKDNPGSMVLGPWVHGDTWNFLQKVAVSGSVVWPNALFSDMVTGAIRLLTGNGLPISHGTGVFPVQSGDAAAKYDPNPNSISAQSLREELPASPTYSETPYCMGGEVGIMLTGVPLFNAFDAGLRDAPAHELQDSCDGHPQGSGEYHYHSLSACFKDTDISTVLGFAYDGFPITGGQVAAGKYLSTDDLDVCHGLTSEVVIDGATTTTYHYVMTRDFPYSAGCFRGKPVTTGPSAGTPAQQGGQQGSGSPQQAPGGGHPPQEAIDACSGKSKGAACSLSTPRGVVSGTCDTPPGSSLACIPR